MKKQISVTIEEKNLSFIDEQIAKEELKDRSSAIDDCITFFKQYKKTIKGVHMNNDETYSQVIDGKKYNTDTAIKLAEFWNGVPETDFKYVKEVLYKTKKGQYFIHGEGGALTAYSRPAGNMKTGSEDIRLLSEDEAMEWVETNCNEEYDSIFESEEG